MRTKALAVCALLLVAAGAAVCSQPLPAAPDRPGFLEALPVSFETDARLELLSAALFLAEEEGPAHSDWDYARLARKRLKPLAGHRAAAETRALVERSGSALVPTQILLHLGPPPALAPVFKIPDGHVSQAGGREALERWLAALRALAMTQEFAAFWKDGAAARARVEAEARLEAGRHYDPAPLLSYLRLGPPARHRFLLAPLLPPRYAANARPGVEELRVRSPSDVWEGVARFGFDDFSSGLPHELAHTALDPWLDPHRARLEFLGPPPKRCTDSWDGCVAEHVVFAVTLRALAAEDAAAYRRAVEDYAARGFPKLPALCRLLEREYEAEAARYPTLREFYPRMLAVFGLAPEPALPAAAATPPPPKPAPTPPARAVAQKDTTRGLRDAGVAAFQAGRLEEAAALFGRAVSERGSDAEAWLDLAVVEAARGRREEALKAYERCLALVRKSGDGTLHAEALSSRAGAFDSWGRAEEARRDREAALSVAPPDWRRRGEVARLLESNPKPQ